MEIVTGTESSPTTELHGTRGPALARVGAGIAAGGDEQAMEMRVAAPRAAVTPQDELRDLLGIAFESLPLGAVVTGLDGTLLHVNPAVCRMLGRSADELRRHKIIDFLGAGQRATMSELTASILEGGVSDYHQHRIFVRPDGSLARLDATGTVLKSAAGKPRAILVIYREIADPPPAVSQPDPVGRLWMLASEDSGADGVTLREEFDSFCRTVSQEFRIPLRIIEGYADIVVQDCDDGIDQVSRRYLHTIRDQSRRLSSMIDNTLSLAKLMTRPLSRASIDLSAVATDAVAEVRAEHHAHDVEVRIEPGLVADADATLAARMMKQLFENAFRFSRSAARPCVEFGRTDAEEASAFFVRDNGVGFDMASAYRLFLPFETLHEGSEVAGDGVGLAEVRRIVSRHGGNVWAEGSPGGGATFYFTLPPAPGPASSASKE